MDEVNKWYLNLTYGEAKGILQENLASMKQSFIAAGYYLKYIRDNELFREDGYKTIWEFADDNYGIKMSTASRWMAMNDKFSQGGNSPILAEEYKKFGKSQLQEMLYLKDEQLEEVAPDMTVKEIREVRKPEQVESESVHEECEECMLRGNPDAGILECHPEEGEHKCVTGDLDVKESFAAPQAEQDKSSSCPPDVSSCVRQEWGTAPEQQEMGHKECKKCWNEYEKREKVLGKLGSESFAVSQQVSASDEQGVHHFTTKHESIDDAYGWSWAEIVNEYLRTGYKAPAKECEVVSHGFPHKVLKRKDITVFYDASGETLFDVENERLEQEYEFLMGREGFAEEQDTEGDEPGFATSQQDPEEVPELETVVDAECTEIEKDAEYTPQFFLKEQNRKLDDMLRVEDVPEIILERQKTIVCALASMVSQLKDNDVQEETFLPEQPELPILKNNDLRKEFIDAYEGWPVWIGTKETGEKYYRYNLSDGTAMVVKVYFHKCFDYAASSENRYRDGWGSEEYYLLKDGKYFKDCLTNKSYLMEHLKELQKGEKKTC